MQSLGGEMFVGEGDVKTGERCGLGERWGLGGFFCRFLLIDTS